MNPISDLCQALKVKCTRSRGNGGLWVWRFPLVILSKAVAVKSYKINRKVVWEKMCFEGGFNVFCLENTAFSHFIYVSWSLLCRVIWHYLRLFLAKYSKNKKGIKKKAKDLISRLSLCFWYPMEAEFKIMQSDLVMIIWAVYGLCSIMSKNCFLSNSWFLFKNCLKYTVF